jgi:hypothetical protein
VDFRIEHSLTSAPEHVAEVLLDRDYQEHLGDHLGAVSHRKVLGQKELSEGRVERRIRCVLELHLGGAAERFLGGADPAYVETAIWHPDDLRWDWTIEPEVAKELLDARGSIHILPNGSGTIRAVDGTVRVKFPLYGGKVEGWIVEGLEDAYCEEAGRLQAWLDAGH